MGAAPGHAIARGGERFSLHATTCFETFPFPWPPGQEPADDPRVEAIAQAAQELVRLRDAWLNPPAASDAESEEAHADQPLQRAAHVA